MQRTRVRAGASPAGNEPMTIRVITFDLDNTLWDVEPALLRAEQAQREWLLEHRPGSIEQHDHDSLWEFKKRVWKQHPELAHHVSQMRVRMLFELQRAAGYSEADSDAGAREAFAAFLQERHKVELYAEALEVLQRLAGDYRLGALTNGNADIYKTDAAEYFDFAFLAEDVGASKPAADMFHAALARTGAAAGEIVHVGDNPEHDILGAKQVGLRTVWVNLAGAPWEPADYRADAEVTALRDLPAAIAGLGAAG
ncbi:HAD family hydrolase [Haliea sp.]|jgi:HAD superfamily hydrolase (TIGR01549 family)|uniref:HAD family hydrolase n=2 Tax=Halieaceae TaxID=1706372 RepID=UPI00257F6924|nr:HAD family hydrolase [Haliea sp.]|tara:strand:- start:8916 stop:9677 length:762 start_codon:yes stop_codon:yes gene_type:complete